LRSNVSNKDKPSHESTKAITATHAGVGVNYKHAFNFDNVFLAPGVFFEHLGSKTKYRDEYFRTDASIDYRYGAKLDLGYDIADNFAAYFTNGLSVVNYRFKDHFDNGMFTDDVKKSGRKIGYFYGAGLSYKINKEFALNLEYNAQKSLLKIDNYGGKLSSKIRVAKIGVSYNF